jgi:hypothetical protein
MEQFAAVPSNKWTEIEPASLIQYKKKNTEDVVIAVILANNIEIKNEVYFRLGNNLDCANKSYHYSWLIRHSIIERIAVKKNLVAMSYVTRLENKLKILFKGVKMIDERITKLEKTLDALTRAR